VHPAGVQGAEGLGAKSPRCCGINAFGVMPKASS